MGDLSPSFLLQNFCIKYFLKYIWPSFHLFFYGEASFIHELWIGLKFVSNCDRNICCVLIKFLVTMCTNLISKYVYFEIGTIILDLLIMVNYYEKQLNLALVINVKWLYHMQSFRKLISWEWLNHEPQALELSFYELLDIPSVVFQICIMKTYQCQSFRTKS